MKDADPLQGLTAEAGLHMLKDEWCQKSYIGAQSEYLTKNLKRAIEVTFEKAPSRTSGFQLDRPLTEQIDDKSRERLWERSLLQHWSSKGAYSVPECWHRLIAFQVPLTHSGHEEDGWGEIDLLGVNKRGGPVVVELKKDPPPVDGGRTGQSESPMRMILEGWAYAIALKKAWPHLVTEFENQVSRLDEHLLVPRELLSVPIVGAAPAAYWIDWLPVADKGRSGVSLSDWRLFSALLEAMSHNGFPVSFLSIRGDAGNPHSLAAQPLKNFPLLEV